jgi:hypothetical protein
MLLLVAFVGQLSMHVAADRLAYARMRQAVARADARFALRQAVAQMARWPGMDACATANGDGVAGSAQKRWTLCEKADGNRAYLVSTLPADSHTAADVLLEPSDGADPAIYAPGEVHRDSSGAFYAKTAWWAGDLGLRAPLAPEDGRTDARLFSSLSAKDAAAARVLLRQMMPGPYAGTDASYTSRRSAFVLSNAYDGGLREDLSALPDAGVGAYTHPPSEGEIAWLASRVPVGGGLATNPGPARFEPVVTEFLLACGLGANSDEYYVPNRNLNIVLTYHVYVEIWNPTTRTMKMGSASPDIRVVVRGLPTVTGTSQTAPPYITLPDPLVVDADSWDDIPPGGMRLLACPASGGGSNQQGAWQVNVGTIYTGFINYTQAVTLHFSSASPVVEFYDLASASTEPFFTLSLKDYAAFDMNYGSGATSGYFFRSAVLTTSYGMGRAAINACGWAFAYHMRLKDDDLAKLLRGYDPRDATVDLNAPSGGDAFHYVLAEPEKYVSTGAIMDSDFFATRYRNLSYADRLALFADPPAMETFSFASLRHAPTEGRAAFAVGAGIVPEADAELDRYFFSTLPSGVWNGAEPLVNFRLVPARRGGSVTRAADDASTLLQRGGFNINSTDARVWKAVLSTLEFPSWDVSGPSSAATLDLAAPFYSLPWSAAFPPTNPAEASLAAGDTSAWADTSNSLYKNRRHPSFLVGARDLGPDLDALAENLARLIRERGRPFHSLAEFAGSRVLQQAIDETAAINLREGSVDAIPSGSTANVEQGEVICALSPMLFSRSDTFLVRAYGRDASTGAETVCEAVVQRLPDAVNGDAAKFGRRLKVMSIRWLSPGDL